MPESEVRERISAYELKQWELLETIQPWGGRYLAARIIQSIAGGKLSEILNMLKNEKTETDEELFERQVRSVNRE